MNHDNNGAIEKLLEELGSHIHFKETLETGDTVIVLRENDDGRVSMVYALVLGFDRDISKRDEWWHVHFVFLEVPPLPRTITLQSSHFTGKEIFTMGGRKIFIKAINSQAYVNNSFLNPETDKMPVNKSHKPSEKKPTFTLVK